MSDSAPQVHGSEGLARVLQGGLNSGSCTCYAMLLCSRFFVVSPLQIITFEKGKCGTKGCMSDRSETDEQAGKSRI